MLAKMTQPADDEDQTGQNPEQEIDQRLRLYARLEPAFNICEHLDLLIPCQTCSGDFGGPQIGAQRRPSLREKRCSLVILDRRRDNDILADFPISRRRNPELVPRSEERRARKEVVSTSRPW